jgi:hypothetical protein
MWQWILIIGGAAAVLIVVIAVVARRRRWLSREQIEDLHQSLKYVQWNAFKDILPETAENYNRMKEIHGDRKNTMKSCGLVNLAYTIHMKDDAYVHVISIAPDGGSSGFVEKALYWLTNELELEFLASKVSSLPEAEVAGYEDGTVSVTMALGENVHNALLNAVGGKDSWEVFNKAIDSGEIDMGAVFDYGPRVDAVENASGNFGYSKKNPIPVNGVEGEIEYLSKLHCACGEAFAFHRLGNYGDGPDGHTIDGYEMLCRTGTHHIMLYLDMYHQGPSTLCPKDLVKGPSEGFGSNMRFDDFPRGMIEHYEKLQKEQGR